ncbi:hypothetical protein HDU93_007614 [Gonapodya sp. JEL0774]|nr:hypothetical protein HDU93_007614 [Gonapodya sp. JEL0774]
MDALGTADPYFKLFRRLPDTTDGWLEVHKSEVVKNTLEPTWQPVEIPFSTLCHGCDPDPEIKIEVWDWDMGTAHDFIGSVIVSFREIEKTAPCKVPTSNQIQFANTLTFYRSANSSDRKLVNERKKLKHADYTNSGRLIFETLEMTGRDSFQLSEFLQDLDIAVTVAVDFTSSNGKPNEPSSLHYFSPTTPPTPSLYESTLRLLLHSTPLESFDRTHRITAVGFGARFKDGHSPAMFPLNGNNKDSHCEGLEGVVEAYRKVMGEISFFGPTNLAPLVDLVAGWAKKKEDRFERKILGKYSVLIILTDGEITDLKATTNALVRASRFPMSVIIVGIGKRDGVEWEELEKLDGDQIVLKNEHGEMAARDCVQFVKRRKNLEAE